VKIVLAVIGAVVSGAWVWGSFTGRLPSMLAGAISPSWVSKTGGVTPTSATSQAAGSTTAAGRGG
jgi:hypothetical protein